MNRNKKRLCWELLLIVLGTGMMALAISCIYDPIGLVTGGFSGIAILVRNLTDGLVPGGVPLWLTNLLLNVPVFLCAYRKFGAGYVGRTFFGTLLLSLWLYLIPPMDLAEGDYLLAALFGGVFTGIGFGLVLRAGATTGGTDLVAALIQPGLRHYSVVQIMQVIDGLVVLLGLYVFGLRPALYAVVAIFVTTKMGDSFLEGFKSSKAALIITNRYEEVAGRLMRELDRGVTGLDAKGMYTHRNKCVLYCVVSRKEIVSVKDIVGEVDPDAFVIVSDVREVLGEGFLEYHKDV
ncbi:MAG: YitT family protein [Muribaculaceae bacterium]|nr:YitT family protein [Roseburia sp.]MCM1431839.1 YitT family protein [Muribaculaceae bacterium]MCM1493520.1 YitT family protein [Muribaculaceae bacterium]